MNELSDPPEPGEPAVARADPVAERANRYVPRILQQHLVDNPGSRDWTSDGTAVFVDIAGFTALSERLARKGREGAEQISTAIGDSFEAVLLIAYENGGSLLKFGGDALLLWFEGAGHVTRACRAAILMRRTLREVGRIDVPGAKVTLRMSQGVHSGRFHFFAVGDTHTELLTTGPAWSRLVTMEQAARAGDIVVSPETAALLPARCTGDHHGPGVLLRREPPGVAEKVPLKPRPKIPAAAVTHCLPPAVREHVLEGGGTSEHRAVTIAFLRFSGTDATIERTGTAATAQTLDRLLKVVETAVESQGVAFLASDVDADGGKLILTAGAPKVTGDDEERMLLALRQIVDATLPIPVQIGVHRGSVFAGDIGPAYRRTYTVMGDAVNLSARLMAAAKPGLIYATAEVLDHSNTLFECEELPPLSIKGKAKPVAAWSVKKATGSRTRNVTPQSLPLVGRDVELGALRKALAGAQAGAGRLIEVVGEPGIGKTRMLEALRGEAAGFRRHHAVCEAYTASTPYAVWHELLREFLGFGRDDPDAVVAEHLHDAVATHAPDLTPWLPLIAIALGVEVPSTPEVEMLAENNRRAKLHEAVGRFLVAAMPDAQLIEIEDAHHMDGASAELLSYLTGEIEARPWLFGVARRPAGSGFVAPESPAVTRIELKPLEEQDAVRMIRLATEEHPLHMHVVEVVAQRSGGNPQFLRDLAHSAVVSGGIGGLPDSAEAAAMAQIDSLAPRDRDVVRRAAVFGQTFHPRMLSWLTDSGDDWLPGPDMWNRLHAFFSEEGDGYLRFRRSILRDAAYEGLPYKLRRQLHGTVAERIAQESDDVDDDAGILSLHYLIAGDNRSAWRFGTVAGKQAADVNAYVEAARLYTRALEAGRRLGDLGAQELAPVHRALGDAWYRASEYGKASDSYLAARELSANDPLGEASLLLDLSRVEAKLGQCEKALRWTEQARAALQGLEGEAAARQMARLGAWYAMVLQTEGRTTEAQDWARRTVTEAEAADEPEALGDAYYVLGCAYGELGRDEAVSFMERSQEAHLRSGNRARQADVLTNLGLVYQWAGRWDEALTHYERGRIESEKIGDTVGAGLARVNIAEILIDRGEWTQAEAQLLETLPLWKASQYRYYLGACLLFLGRVHLCLGRLDEAVDQLEQAKANFLHFGAEEQVPLADARIAECRLAAGDADASLGIVRDMLGRASSSVGVGRVVSLIERVQAHALVLKGDLRGARDALNASLTAARGRKDHFESTLTMLSVIELDRREGVAPPREMVEESRSLLAGLKVRATPPVPLGGA